MQQKYPAGLKLETLPLNFRPAGFPRSSLFKQNVNSETYLCFIALFFELNKSEYMVLLLVTAVLFYNSVGVGVWKFQVLISRLNWESHPVVCL